MLLAKLRESLTVRLFCLTFAIVLAASATTFGLIALVTPVSYTAMMTDQILQRLDSLLDTLAETKFDDAVPLLTDFIQECNVELTLFDYTGTQLIFHGISSDRSMVATVSPDGASEGAAQDFTWSSADESTVGLLVDPEGGYAITSTMSTEDSAIATEAIFLDQPEPYGMLIVPQTQAVNQAVQALEKVAPWLLLAMLLFSAACAFFYSRYLARPIVRLSGIAQRMAGLDFGWQCQEQRRDEIGVLGRSLDHMAQQLSGTLTELKQANDALRGEMEQERELERQRLAFFSAASHELKTPITILKGQLTGMLDGVDVYRDRDKYLARSLQVTGRMETLVQEILTISRMESGAVASKLAPLDLSELVRQQLELDRALFAQRQMRVQARLTPALTLRADAAMLAKAVENVLSNAAAYSPDGASIRVQTRLAGGHAILTIENTGVQIGDAALPHLFEAFYREEQSRNRKSGGSGLGLYLVRMILDQHGADYHIENIPDGVRFTARFPLH